MQTLTRRFPLPAKEFEFAGFSFPRYLGQLPKGSITERLERHKNPSTGPYYLSPTPNAGGHSFYLDSDFMPALRWQWCDEIAQSIRHTGWFTDEYGIGETIRGIVFRLPAGRGFLAGWSMGEGMASSVEYIIYTDEISAAYAADSLAETIAEQEREYQEELDNEEEEE